MANKHTKKWPDDYYTFEGNMNELVKAANEILGHLGSDADITERSLRNYQHKELVGRGVKKGKSAHFGFEELSQLVATKSLVKQGWTLNHTASLLQSDAPAPQAHEQQSFYSSTLPSSNSAVDVVNQLMNQSGVSSSTVASSTSKAIPPSHLQASSQMVRKAVYATHAMPLSTTSSPRQVQVFEVTEGVSVQIENDTWQKLPPHKQNEFLQHIASFFKDKP